MSMTSYNFLGQGFKLIIQLCLAFAVISLASVFITLLWVNLQGAAGIYQLHALIEQDTNTFAQHLSISRWIINVPSLQTTIEHWLQQQTWLIHSASVKEVILKELDLGLTIIQWLLLRTAYYCYVVNITGLLCVVGFVDGLSQRTIRRCNGQRESATVYHQAKAGCLFFIIMLMLMLIVVPLNISRLQPIIFIQVLLLACCVQITAKQFKKYL